MKNRNLFIDAATILSSLLLVTGFICYRAGMFNRLLADNPPPAAATGNAAELTSGPTSEVIDINGTLLPGSKSFDIASPLPTAVSSRPGAVHHAPSQEQTPPTPPAVTVIMPGSKSVFIPVAPTFPVGNQPPPPPPVTPPPAPPQAAPVTSPPVILPGSKSPAIFPLVPPSPAPPPPPVQQAAPTQKP
jgi:hypothetical protein